MDESFTILKKFCLPFADVSLRSDNIVHVHFRKNIVLDLELQENMRKIYKEATGGKVAHFLFSSDEGFSLSKEARENSRVNPDPHIGAYALVANNLAYRIIGNFVRRINSPKVPFRLFSNEEEASSWLRSLKK